MISEKQWLANRQNALRSTGPRTTEGRAIASQNAIRHGLRAQTTVIAGENAEEFDQFRQLLLEDLAPDGAMEVFLADRIVAGFWKLRRAGRIETELFNEMNIAPQGSDSGKDKSGLPIEIVVRKTYECPVHGRSIEQENPPEGCQSCPITQPLQVPEGGKIPPSAMKGPSDSAVSDNARTETKPRSPLSLGRIFKQDMAGSNILTRFRFYEGQIEASLYKALTELQKLQLLRAKVWQISEQSQTNALPDRSQQEEFKR
ncbi:MAG: hypothetical protein L0Y36_01640 [Planctomycetales bacterium]|nr:hypothetical protein [Planctomycetales bacterium]